MQQEEHKQIVLTLQMWINSAYKASQCHVNWNPEAVRNILSQVMEPLSFPVHQPSRENLVSQAGCSVKRPNQPEKLSTPEQVNISMGNAFLLLGFCTITAPQGNPGISSCDFSGTVELSCFPAGALKCDSCKIRKEGIARFQPDSNDILSSRGSQCGVSKMLTNCW